MNLDVRDNNSCFLNLEKVPYPKTDKPKRKIAVGGGKINGGMQTLSFIRLEY
jgi:hypothetical protein